MRRRKNGLSVEQPIAGDELRAIKRYLATRTDGLPWLFICERGQPLTRQSVNYLVASAAARAGLPPVWPHMLRHSCGFYLANRGHDLRLIQDYLGHRDPKHTVHYTRTAGIVSDPAADEQLVEVRNRCTTSGDRVVAVTVDERHASTVVEILAMRAPAIMTEAPLLNVA